MQGSTVGSDGGARVLLVSTNRERQPYPVVPNGLACVASALDAAGHQVRFLPRPARRRGDSILKSSVSPFETSTTAMRSLSATILPKRAESSSLFVPRHRMRE